MSRLVYQHGLVIGKFYPPHLGHEYLIRTAALHCRQLTVAVLGASVESIPMEQRAAWLRESFADLSHVRIVAAQDDVRIDYDCPKIWAQHVEIMRAAVEHANKDDEATPAVDAVFTSESYGTELARQFAASHVCLDQSRSLYPVSGTSVRANPPGNWEFLSPAVRAGLARRVVIVGAESTGTTTLSRDLVKALRARGGVWGQTGWVAEYGREYSANLLALARANDSQTLVQDIVWDTKDFAEIAAEQCRREHRAAMHGGPLLVCDTDALATCIWHERYMGYLSDEVGLIAAAMPTRALYLLTSEVGVPFEDDGLRDGEHLRSWMNERFREVLSMQPVPWLELNGPPAERCAMALNAIDKMLASSWQFAPPLEQQSS